MPPMAGSGWSSHASAAASDPKAAAAVCRNSLILASPNPGTLHACIYPLMPDPPLMALPVPDLVLLFVVLVVHGLFGGVLRALPTAEVGRRFSPWS